MLIAITTLELFRSLVRGGYVYQGYKPVYWSPVSRTALADSEIEYDFTVMHND